MGVLTGTSIVSITIHDSYIDATLDHLFQCGKATNHRVTGLSKKNFGDESPVCSKVERYAEFLLYPGLVEVIVHVMPREHGDVGNSNVEGRALESLTSLLGIRQL